MLKYGRWRRRAVNGHIFASFFPNFFPDFAGFDSGVFDLAHRPQQRRFAVFRRDLAVGLEQFPQVTDQIRIREQARPVRPFGRLFRGFAHTHVFPHAVFRCWEGLGSHHRLNFGRRLHKMTKVTDTSGSAPAKRYGPALHREPAQQFASDPYQKESKRLIIFVSQGEEPGSMASADRPTRQLRCCYAFLLRIALLIVSTVIFRAPLCAQSSNSNSNSNPTYGSTVSSAGVAMQVPTSAQNPVFGSVPEAKPTPGVLPLTFSDAIERALRQNLAGLLSEYNTVEARGEKWQKLSDLLPNVNGTVQEAVQKQSLEALGLNSALFPGGSKPPRVIGPFDYFDVRASATQRLFDWKAIQKYRY